MGFLSSLGSNTKQGAARSQSTRKRRLTVESLEGKRLLALLGVDPGVPLIAYDSTGTVDYDNVAQTLDLVATPLAFKETEIADPAPVELPGIVEIHIQVDNAGNLIGGVVGNDLIVTGTINNGTVDVSGVLLTGEVTAFGFAEGGNTDAYDFRFTVTGGALAAYFAGKEIGVTTTSENSTFENSFAVAFHGGAKGNIGAIDAETGSLSGHKFKDRTGNGITADDTPLGGVTIQLLRDVDGNGQYDPNIDGPVLATTVTAAGTGEYSFDNLAAGTYIVREVVPNGFKQTGPATGFYAVTVVAGTVTEDLDFSNAKKNDCRPKPKHCDPPKPKYCEPPKGRCEPKYDPPKHCDNDRGSKGGKSPGRNSYCPPPPPPPPRGGRCR